jgi:hypothetical protein
MSLQIPKEIPGLPDSYGVVIHLKDTSQLSHECVHHHVDAAGILTIVTKEDTVRLINWSEVRFMDLDQRWTKTLELQRKFSQQQKQNAKS